MDLYLDDCRSAPDGFVLVKTARECIDALKAGGIEHLSLDHDLGDACLLCWTDTGPVLVKGCAPDCQCDCHPTGYSVCLWMAEFGVWPRYKPQVHSANPVGATNMRAVIDRYWPGTTP